MFTEFFHHLFTAHCPQCEHEKDCKSCETLRELLTEERFTNKRLLDKIIELTQPKVVTERDTPPAIEYKPIGGKHVSWKVKQAALEEEDRAKARLLDKMRLESVPVSTSVEELEKELGVADAG